MEKLKDLMNQFKINKKFVEYFSAYPECYVIIGGTAMLIVARSLGLVTRITKDYDIVLIESLSCKFIDTFHRFIKDGGYNLYTKSENKYHNLYRFDKPNNKEFPEMIELFSRKPINIDLKVDDQHTPLHFSESESLSALILNDKYYDLLQLGTELSEDNIPFIKLTHLIVFKAKAWLDLSAKKQIGEYVKNSDIKKYINDIFNLISGFKETDELVLKDEIRQNMQIFIGKLTNEKIDYAKNIGSSFSFSESIHILKKVYNLQ